MTPEDIRRIVVVEELDLSADGRLAVVVRRSIKGDRYHGHLFAIDLERREVPRPRQLTRGAVRDTRPRLCSDGRTVAFVRTTRPTTTRRPGSRCSTSSGQAPPCVSSRPAITEPSSSSPGLPTAAASPLRPRSTRRGSSSGRPRPSAAGADRTRRSPRHPRHGPGASPGPTGAGTRRDIAIAGRTCSSSIGATGDRGR